MKESKCYKCKYYKVRSDSCSIVGCSPLSGYRHFKLADDAVLDRRKQEIDKLKKRKNLIYNVTAGLFTVWLIYSVVMVIFTLQVMLSHSQSSYTEILLSLVREYPIQYLIVFIGGLLSSTEIVK